MSIISLDFFMGLKLHQMDVKTAFLNGIIEEEVYMKQLEGFVIHEKESHVCRLKKALYGLTQAPWVWYSRIDSYLTELASPEVKQIRTFITRLLITVP